MQNEISVNASDLSSWNAGLTVSNAVWIAAALLHRGAPGREGFAVEEIVRVVREENLTRAAEDSVWTHVRQHSVANKKPNPNTVCMLFDPGGGLRRLFRMGDRIAPGRNVERTHPEWDALPERFVDLRRWYDEEWIGLAGKGEDPLLALAGTWKFGTADRYVAELREGWEGR